MIAQRILHRVSGFSLSVLLVTVLGVASMPFLVASLGAGTWGILALIQSVSQIGGIVVAFGWGATGAATIAGLEAAHRAEFFRSSLRIRIFLYAATVPIVGIVLGMLTRGMWMESLLGAATYLLPSLGASWFYIGEGSASRLIRLDTIPVVVGGVVGIGAAAITETLVAYMLCQGLGYLVAVLLAAVVILPRSDRAGVSATSWQDALLSQRHAVLATLTSSLYVALPMVSVQIFLPGLQPVYALADRLFRYASVAFQPVQQFFQSWVPERGSNVQTRSRIAVVAAAGIGILGGAAIALLSPLVSPLLSSFEIRVPLSYSAPLGVAFIGIAIAAVVGYACLVVLGRTAALAVSTVIGAVVGAPLIVTFAVLGSVPLVAWSVAASELCVAGYQVVVLRRALSARGAV